MTERRIEVEVEVGGKFFRTTLTRYDAIPLPRRRAPWIVRPARPDRDDGVKFGERGVCHARDIEEA